MRSVAVVLVVVVAGLAGCSESAEVPEPDPLEAACAVVTDFDEIRDAYNMLEQKLEDAGYRYSPNRTMSDQVIYREWRTANMAALEQLRDAVTVVIVDARGLIASANPYGSVVLRYAQDRQEFYQYIVVTSTGAIVQREFDSASAEYEVVRERCSDSAQGAAEPT
jgi:hypothetical protein